MLVLEAFALMEGFYREGNPRPARNNNPLDLEYGPEAKAFGATGTDGRFAVFPSLQTGWEAAKKWLSVPAQFSENGGLVHGYLGATYKQAITRFAPPFENNTTNYVEFVCSKTGHKPEDVFKEEDLELPADLTPGADPLTKELLTPAVDNI